MSSESKTAIAALRSYYQDEIETMIRQMKIEGGTLDDCLAELNLLADFVHSQADVLKVEWPSLLVDTSYESWEQRQNEANESRLPLPKSEP